MTAAAVDPGAADDPGAARDPGDEPRGPMVRLASLLGCTEGQAYTVVIGLVVTIVAASLGLPPTLRDRAAPAGAALPAAGPTADPPAAPDGPAADPTAPPAVGTAPFGTGTGTGSGASSPATSGSTDFGLTGDGGTAGSDLASAPGMPKQVTFGPARVAAKVGAPGSPDGVAFDGQGRLYVATNNGLTRGERAPSRLLRYTPDGRLDREVAIIGQAPVRANGLTGVALARDGAALVLDTAPARVLRIDVGAGRQETWAEVPDLPACRMVVAADACEPGAADDAPLPRAIALDGDGTAFVTDAAQGVIWRIAAGGKAEPWYRLDDSEALAGPAGLAFDGGGDLLVIVSPAAEPPGGGQVRRIDVRADGAAGDATPVAGTQQLSRPVGLAIGPEGTLAVALAGSNELVLFAADGTETARLTADAVEQQAGVPLDGPTGLAVRDGSLLVTNQSPVANDADHWAVLEVGLTR